MNYDYSCPDYNHVFEYTCRMADKPLELPCPVEGCGKVATFKIFQVCAMPTHIILDYPGSKQFKAGYVHSHGPKPATKNQIGYGGAVSSERKHRHPIANNVIPEAVQYSNDKR